MSTTAPRSSPNSRSRPEIVTESATRSVTSASVVSGMPWLSVVLALGAALLFAIGAVGQQQAAATNVGAGSGRLIVRLITNPRWLAASFGNMCGYGLQAAALAAGSLLIVQPLL